MPVEENPSRLGAWLATAFSMLFPFLGERRSFQRSFCVIILPSRAALLTIFPSSRSSKPHNKICGVYRMHRIPIFGSCPGSQSRTHLADHSAECHAPSRCTTHTSFTVFFSGLTRACKYETVPVQDDSHVSFGMEEHCWCLFSSFESVVHQALCVILFRSKSCP